MIAVANHTGRLIELCVESPVSRQDTEGLGAELRRVLPAQPAKVVIAADMAMARTLPPAVVDDLIAIMRSDNPSIERSGLLVPDDAAVFGMQVERMIKDAGIASRRVFRDALLWQTWLAELLSPAEARRLHQFALERAAARSR
jgi:hypothetical protein